MTKKESGSTRWNGSSANGSFYAPPRRHAITPPPGQAAAGNSGTYGRAEEGDHGPALFDPVERASDGPPPIPVESLARDGVQGRGPFFVSPPVSTQFFHRTP